MILSSVVYLVIAVFVLFSAFMNNIYQKSLIGGASASLVAVLLIDFMVVVAPVTSTVVAAVLIISWLRDVYHAAVAKRMVKEYAEEEQAQAHTGGVTAGATGAPN